MSSRRFRKELAEQLPSWQERGWVTPEAAASLRAAYELDKPALRLGQLILGLFGSALLLGGLILILAHNWEELGRPARGLLSLLPLGLTAWLGHWALRRRPDSAAFAEGLGLANALALCGAISLVAQTYQISGDLPRFLLTWALFSLGIAYVMGSGVVLVLYHVLASCWAWNQHSPATSTLGYLLLVGASAPFFLRQAWGGPRPQTCRAVRLPLFLCVSATLAAPLHLFNHEGWLLLAYAPWLAAAYLLADAPGRPLGGGIRWLAAIGLATLLIVFSFEGPWRNLGFDLRRGHEAHDVALNAGVLIGLLHCGVLAALVSRRRDLDLSGWLWAAAGFLGCVAWLAQPGYEEAGIYALACNVFTGALALGTLFVGVTKGSTLRTNLGWLLLSTLLLCRFFDSQLSFLAKGLAFCALGAGFLGVNLYLHRRRRSLAAPNSGDTLIQTGPGPGHDKPSGA